MKNWLAIGCFLLCLPLVRAEDFKDQIYRAYLSGEMDEWKEIMDRMYARYITTRNSGVLEALTEAEYGYIAYLISSREKREASRLLDRADSHIDRLVSLEPDNARYMSLRGAFYGFRVSMEKLKAPVYGPKSVEANERALELDPLEPMAWMERGNIEFYKPAIFGGSVEEAVSSYRRAVELFEGTPGRTQQNWIYLNCLTGLAMAYEENGQIREAGQVYRKLLRLEPSFVWVRDDLYPGFREKHLQN